MKTYKIAGGHIVDRETGETAESVHGTITAVDITETDKGTRHLNLTFKDGEEEAVLRVKLYGDASMKILRCLYGVVATIAEQPTTVSIENREGASGLIRVLQGEREIPALGSVPPYADHRALLIQRLYTAVKDAVASRWPVATVTVRTASGNDVVFDDPAAEDVAGKIRETILAGRRGDVTIRKHVFSNPSLVAAFLDGARSLGNDRVYVTDDPSAIELLDEAWGTEPPTAPISGAEPEDNEEA